MIETKSLEPRAASVLLGETLKNDKGRALSPRIPSVFPAVFLLIWLAWGASTTQSAQTGAIKDAAPVADKISTNAVSVQGDSVPQPLAEAANLKREAVAIAQQVAESYPADALAYALLGSASYNTGQAEKANEYLNRCLELNPNQAEVYEILARIAYEKGQLEEAVRLSQEALKRGPANPEVLNQLGRALMDLGRTEDAVQTLQQAVGLSKPISESSYLLGQARLQSGDHAKAKESFQRAIALQPEHTQAYFGLYTACTRLGQTEEASKYREQFQKLEAIDRRSLTDRSAQVDTLTGLPLVRTTVAKTVFGAAQIYRAHQQPLKAGELLRKSAQLDPESMVYRAALESYYVQGKALAEGVTAFEQLATEQPDNALNHLFLGRLHSRLQKFEPAEKGFRRAQELAPRWAEGYRALAELYLRSNQKVTEARAPAQRAVELEPSGAHYQYWLAVACAKNGDRPAALAAVKQAVALSPSDKRYGALLKQLTEARSNE